MFQQNYFFLSFLRVFLEQLVFRKRQVEVVVEVECFLQVKVIDVSLEMMSFFDVLKVEMVTSGVFLILVMVIFVSDSFCSQAMVTCNSFWGMVIFLSYLQVMGIGNFFLETGIGPFDFFFYQAMVTCNDFLVQHICLLLVKVTCKCLGRVIWV